jgi:hypothetical protein
VGKIQQPARMTNITHEFEAEVHKAISMILAASHKTALSMLDEAFGKQRKIHQAVKGQQRQRSPDASTPTGVRRSRADVDAIADKLMQEIWSTPGQSITVIASRMGIPPVELKIPIRRLKDQGKLKTAGVSQFTKYFPIAVPNGGQRSTS